MSYSPDSHRFRFIAGIIRILDLQFEDMAFVHILAIIPEFKAVRRGTGTARKLAFLSRPRVYAGVISCPVLWQKF